MPLFPGRPPAPGRRGCVAGWAGGQPNCAVTGPRTSRAASASSVALFTRRPAPSSRRGSRRAARGSFDKERRGRDGNRGGGDARPAGPSGCRPEAEQARRPPRAGAGRREPGTRRPAAAGAVGGDGLRACLRSAATRAAPPAASPRPGFPCQLLRRPLCSCLLWRLFARAGRAHRLRSSACPAGGDPPLSPPARLRGSVPGFRDVGRDAAAQPAGGAGGSGGGWPVAAGDGGGAEGGLFTCRGTSPCRHRTRS